MTNDNQYLLKQRVYSIAHWLTMLIIIRGQLRSIQEHIQDGDPEIATDILKDLISETIDQEKHIHETTNLLKEILSGSNK